MLSWKEEKQKPVSVTEQWPMNCKCPELWKKWVYYVINPQMCLFFLKHRLFQSSVISLWIFVLIRESSFQVIFFNLKLEVLENQDSINRKTSVHWIQIRKSSKIIGCLLSYSSYKYYLLSVCRWSESTRKWVVRKMYMA